MSDESQATSPEGPDAHPSHAAEPAPGEGEDTADLSLPELMRRAMAAQGVVDPDEVFAQAADEDALWAHEMADEPPPLDPDQEQLYLEALSDPDANAVGKFRGDAGKTMIASAVAAYPATGTARRRVLDAIAQAGERGRTDEELQDELNMNPSTERPRRIELVEGGWIEDSGTTRQTDAHRDAVVWALTERGREAWEPPRSYTWEP